jgi:citronellyl-CoA dehydrogenase
MSTFSAKSEPERVLTAHRLADLAVYQAALQSFAQGCSEESVDRWESQRNAPLELIATLAECNLFQPFLLDSEEGCPHLIALAEALGRRRSLGLVGMVLSHLVLPLRLLQRHASSCLNERYLVPALSGHTIGTMNLARLWEDNENTTAGDEGVFLRFEGDRLRLEGREGFVFNAPGGDFMVVLARQGSVSTACSLVALPLDAPGVSVEQLRTIGFHSARIGLVRIRDCYLSPDHLIGEPGQGRQLVVRAMVEHCLLVCAAIQALESEVLSETFTFVYGRKFMGKKLGDLQVIRHRLADLTAEHEITVAFHQSALAECVKSDWQLPGKAAMTSLIVGESFKLIVEGCVQLFGGRGYMAENWLTRVFRDSQCLEILLGTATALRRISAREVGL